MLCAVVLIVFVRKKILNLNFCEILCLGGGMQ